MYNTKDKERAYLKGRRAKRKEWMENLKAAPCMDCLKTFPPCAMDFDHREPTTKDFNIGIAYVSFNLEKLLEEIAKCDLVCANCHRIRTYKRRIQNANNPKAA